MIVSFESRKPARIRQDAFLRETTEDRIVYRARATRYARSGSGYRVIPAGANPFERRDETPRAA